jgi:hypothetical protein
LCWNMTLRECSSFCSAAMSTWHPALAITHLSVLLQLVGGGCGGGVGVMSRVEAAQAQRQRLQRQ